VYPELAKSAATARSGIERIPGSKGNIRESLPVTVETAADINALQAHSRAPQTGILAPLIGNCFRRTGNSFVRTGNCALRQIHPICARCLQSASTSVARPIAVPSDFRPSHGRARDVSDEAVIHCKLGNFTVTVQRPGKVTSGLSTANLAIKASVAA
jgi:hypothetical protein